MTNSSDNWLAEIRAVLSETTQLTRSNAKAIQALGDRTSELTNDIDSLIEVSRQAAAEREELRQAMVGIANLLGSLDEDRPTILRRLSSIENKIDRLLDQNNN